MNEVIKDANSILTSAGAPAGAPAPAPAPLPVLTKLATIKTGSDEKKARELETIINNIVKLKNDGSLELECFLQKFRTGYTKHHDYLNMPPLDDTTYNAILDGIDKDDNNAFNLKVDAYKTTLNDYVVAHKDNVNLLTVGNTLLVAFNNDKFNNLSDNLFPNKSVLTPDIITQVKLSKNITELSQNRKTLLNIFNTGDILNVLYNYIEFEKAYVTKLGELLVENTNKIRLYEKEFNDLGGIKLFDVTSLGASPPASPPAGPPASPPELQPVIDLFKEYNNVKNIIDVELQKTYIDSISVYDNINSYESIKNDTELDNEIKKVSDTIMTNENIHKKTKFDSEKQKIIRLLTQKKTQLNAQKTLFENQLKEKMKEEILKIANECTTNKKKYDDMNDIDDGSGNKTDGNKNKIVNGITAQKTHFDKIITSLKLDIENSYDRVKSTCTVINRQSISDINNIQVILSVLDPNDASNIRHIGLYELGNLLNDILSNIGTTFDTSCDVYTNYSNDLDNLLTNSFYIDISTGNKIENDNSIENKLKSTPAKDNLSTNSPMYEVINKLTNKGNDDNGIWKTLLDAMNNLSDYKLTECVNILKNMLSDVNFNQYHNAIKHIMNAVLVIQIYDAYGKYTRNIGQIIKNSLEKSTENYDLNTNKVLYEKFLEEANVVKINHAYKEINDIKKLIDNLSDFEKQDTTQVTIKDSDYYKHFKNLNDETIILKSLVDIIRDFVNAQGKIDIKVLSDILFNEAYPTIVTTNAQGVNLIYDELKKEYTVADNQNTIAIGLNTIVENFFSKQSEIKDLMTDTVTTAITLFSDIGSSPIADILKTAMTGGKKKVYNRKNKKYGTFVVQKGGYLQDDVNLLVNIQDVLLGKYKDILDQEVQIYPVIIKYNDKYTINKLDDNVYNFYETFDSGKLYTNKLQNSYQYIVNLYQQFDTNKNDLLKKQIIQNIKEVINKFNEQLQEKQKHDNYNDEIKRLYNDIKAKKISANLTTNEEQLRVYNNNSKYSTQQLFKTNFDKYKQIKQTYLTKLQEYEDIQLITPNTVIAISEVSIDDIKNNFDNFDDDTNISVKETIVDLEQLNNDVKKLLEYIENNIHSIKQQNITDEGKKKELEQNINTLDNNLVQEIDTLIGQLNTIYGTINSMVNVIDNLESKSESTSAELVLPISVPDDLYYLVCNAYSICQTNIQTTLSTYDNTIDNYPLAKADEIKYEPSSELAKIANGINTIPNIVPVIKGTIPQTFNFSDIMFLPNIIVDADSILKFAVIIGEHIIKKYNKNEAKYNISKLENINIGEYNQYKLFSYKYDDTNSKIEIGSQMNNNIGAGVSITYPTYRINIMQLSISGKNIYHLLPVTYTDATTFEGGKSKNSTKKIKSNTSNNKLSYKKLYIKNKKMFEKLKKI